MLPYKRNAVISLTFLEFNFLLGIILFFCHELVNILSSFAFIMFNNCN